MNYFNANISQFLADRGLQLAGEFQETKRQAEYQKANDFYRGGKDASKYLIRNVREDADEYAERVSRFANYNYYKRLAQQFISALYGKGVERIFDGPPAKVERAKAIYEANNIERKRQLVAQGMVIHGDAFEKCWYDEERVGTEPIRLSVFSAERIYPIVDPDDCDDLDALIEERVYYKFDRKKMTQEPETRYYLWEPDAVTTLSGEYAAPESVEDGYGVIPFAHFRGLPIIGSYLGMALLEDVITIQEQLNNQASFLHDLVLYQSHGQMIVHSDDPKTALGVGPKRFIQVHGGDTGRDEVSYINPNADIGAVVNSCNWIMEKLCDVGGVPLSAIRGGTASSGLQLAIEYEPMTNLVEMSQVNARAGEQETWGNVQAVGGAHGVNLDNVTMDVRFPKTFLPGDDSAVLQEDLQMVNNRPPLMTVETFVDRHYADRSPKDRKKIFDDLTAAKTQATISLRPSFMGLGMNRPKPEMPPPMSEEEEEVPVE